MVAVIAFVVVGVAVEFVFLPRPSSPAGVPKPSQPVRIAVNQWVSDLKSQNVTALGNLYAPSANVTWTGVAAGLTGTYSGIVNIRVLYGSSIGRDIALNTSVVSYKEKYADSSNAEVTLALYMKGNSSVVGEFAAKVNASQQWNYFRGDWQAVNETWNYITYDVQFRGSHTTFPQWTAMIEGKNPNLVSDKSLEWNFGPYLAASVYAFLAGVVAVGFIESRKRS